MAQVSCTSAFQSGYRVAGNIPSVVVRTSAESAAGYDGFLEWTSAAARSELHARGIETLPFEPPNPATVLPRVELSLLDWEPSHPYTTFVAGSFGRPGSFVRMSAPARAVVGIKAFSPAGKVMLQGQFCSKYHDRYLMDAADAAGHSLAEELAGASTTPQPLRPQSDDLLSDNPRRGPH